MSENLRLFLEEVLIGATALALGFLASQVAIHCGENQTPPSSVITAMAASDDARLIDDAHLICSTSAQIPSAQESGTTLKEWQEPAVFKKTKLE